MICTWMGDYECAGWPDSNLGQHNLLIAIETVLHTIRETEAVLLRMSSKPNRVLDEKKNSLTFRIRHDQIIVG